MLQKDGWTLLAGHEDEGVLNNPPPQALPSWPIPGGSLAFGWCTRKGPAEEKHARQTRDDTPEQPSPRLPPIDPIRPIPSK